MAHCGSKFFLASYRELNPLYRNYSGYSGRDPILDRYNGAPPNRPSLNRNDANRVHYSRLVYQNQVTSDIFFPDKETTWTMRPDIESTTLGTYFMTWLDQSRAVMHTIKRNTGSRIGRVYVKYVYIYKCQTCEQLRCFVLFEQIHEIAINTCGLVWFLYLQNAEIKPYCPGNDRRLGIKKWFIPALPKHTK